MPGAQHGGGVVGGGVVAGGVVLVHPAPPTGGIARVLERCGYRWAPAEPAMREGNSLGWLAMVLSCHTASGGLHEALRLCEAARQRALEELPVLLLIAPAGLADLERGLGERDKLFDDFCVWPDGGSSRREPSDAELSARLRRLTSRAGNSKAHVLAHDGLAMNLETYQASIAGRRLDLTYMEYRLLSFLASHPGKVFTREALLNRVWGYDYYGGARTVDVHIRRLRAKLGEEHAGLIQTVRSVGYRFGRSRWSGA